MPPARHQQIPPPRTADSRRSTTAKAYITLLLAAAPAVASPVVVDTNVIPHVQVETMRFRREPLPPVAARYQIVIHNPSTDPAPLEPFTVAGTTPQDLVSSGKLAWHDTPGLWPDKDRRLPAGTTTVAHLNLADPAFSPSLEITAGQDSTRLPASPHPLAIAAVTFRELDQAVVHIANSSHSDATLLSVEFLTPHPGSHRHFYPVVSTRSLEHFPSSAAVPASDRAIAIATLAKPLPRSYTLAKLVFDHAGETVTRYAHLRAKPERFDISGGWVNDKLGGRSALTFEPYLKTLKRLHINTGQIQETGGYTDNPDLYDRYPIKYFNRLRPDSSYDGLLGRIHAVEFLGEPQYGGGKPVPPQQVFDELAPYQPTRLHTTVTLSEASHWHLYAGLSDFPHFDAYRVTAPAADAWSRYPTDVRWGAPLETAGEMTRSLRDISRPSPVAAWTQGPHRGWRGYRKRSSPTPDELRSQAYHHLSARITSLYWFNLSLPSLAKFRDTLNPITEINRLALALSPLLIDGDSYRNRRTNDRWDLSTVAAPRALLMFALDLDYATDHNAQVFAFKPPRPAHFEFRLPPWVTAPKAVFRVTPDSLRSLPFETSARTLTFSDTASVAAVYIATTDPALGASIDKTLASLASYESEIGFDPANNDQDFSTLTDILNQ
ncbi:MAG: hypothetical protein P8J87_11360 [Verrucomicrobiales bacterium]|nr:hypothetical protein [Verrucomicrobiales bacterium]